MLEVSGGARLAKVTVSIRHISWRDGRPRFEPGPGLRDLGFKGEDLRHPDGEWFSLEQTRLWTDKKIAEIGARRKGEKPKRKSARGVLYTVEDLFDDLFKTQSFKKPREEGGLGEKTKIDYRSKAKLISDFDPELWTSPALAVTKPIALGLHEKLWEEKSLVMANGMIAVARLAFSEAVARGRGGLKVNPFFGMKLPKAKERIRIATKEEIEALMTIADSDDPELRDIEIGDGIMLGLYTGQRKSDVLFLQDRDERDGKVRFIQGKTGARVRMRAIPQLMERIKAIRARKLAEGRENVAEIVIDSHSGIVFHPDTFTHRFADLRAKAAKLSPSVATLKYMDLRDTAVTRLAWAGCTIPEIAAITGHSLKSIHEVLKHYLELDEAHADAAMDKLEAWLEREGIKL